MKNSNYTDHKKRAIYEAKLIHRDFNWERIGKIGAETLQEFIDNYQEPEDTNTIHVNFINKTKIIFGIYYIPIFPFHNKLI